jgi:hypothetical protein
MHHMDAHGSNVELLGRLAPTNKLTRDPVDDVPTITRDA